MGDNLLSDKKLWGIALRRISALIFLVVAKKILTFVQRSPRKEFL